MAYDSIADICYGWWKVDSNDDGEQAVVYLGMYKVLAVLLWQIVDDSRRAFKLCKESCPKQLYFCCCLWRYQSTRCFGEKDLLSVWLLPSSRRYRGAALCRIYFCWRFSLWDFSFRRMMWSVSEFLAQVLSARGPLFWSSFRAFEQLWFEISGISPQQQCH